MHTKIAVLMTLILAGLLFTYPHEQVNASSLSCSPGLLGRLDCYDRDSYVNTLRDVANQQSLRNQQWQLSNRLFQLERDMILRNYFEKLRLSAEQQKQQYDQAEKTLNIVYVDVFQKNPGVEETNYWVPRILKDSLSNIALRDKLNYYKALGKTWPGPTASQVAGAKTTAGTTITSASVPAVVARLFQEVYSRPITPSESTYWKGRARGDKPTESALKGAMAYHKAKGTNH